MSLYLGLMSGTSMDGIDAALVDLPSNQLVWGITQKYSEEVKTRLEDLISGKDLALASLCQLNTLIGRDFAHAAMELLKQANINPDDVSAIGSHGQTVCHDTQSDIPYTMQLGCAHTIAHVTRITVVADFRTRDIVNGGQGAPFAPLYHQELFTHPSETIAVVNIGGISNLTLLTPNQPAKGWDLGPGNCLMDAWINKYRGASYDQDGTWASEGTVIQPLLEQLLTDPFLSRPAPKSIGKEYYSLDWLQAQLQEIYMPVDVQATLVEFTARVIADGLLKLGNSSLKRLYLCGGGTHNALLKRVLVDLLPGISVMSSADIGVDPDFLEAMMFAWLAAQTLANKPLDLTSITGSSTAGVLGAIYPKA